MNVLTAKDKGCLMTNIFESDLAADTLSGASAIAAFLGKTERQTNHLLEKRQIPAFKLGGRWHMRKSTYRSHIERLESAAQRMTSN
jgi:hypothetical protein